MTRYRHYFQILFYVTFVFIKKKSLLKKKGIFDILIDIFKWISLFAANNSFGL